MNHVRRSGRLCKAVWEAGSASGTPRVCVHCGVCVGGTVPSPAGEHKQPCGVCKGQQEREWGGPQRDPARVTQTQGHVGPQDLQTWSLKDTEEGHGQQRHKRVAGWACLGWPRAVSPCPRAQDMLEWHWAAGHLPTEPNSGPWGRGGRGQMAHVLRWGLGA